MKTVESYQKELTRIRKILKENPKGMTVTDISKEMDINRNSIAKYLDILLISGHAEMITFGPAKVFFPSRRIPLSAILNFTLDYIILIDKDLNLIQINENFKKLIEIEKKDLIGQKIKSIPHPLFKISKLVDNAQKALNGEENTIESNLEIDGEDRYLQIKNIPTTFDDGEPGVTIIIEDITERKKSEKKMKQAIKEWEITFNSVSDMICILDKQFNIVKVNNSFADFFKIKSVDCIGKKCHDLLHGTKEIPNFCPCKKIKSTKKTEIVSFFEPNIEKELEITASPIFNEREEFSGSVHIIKDVTETKKN